MIIVTGATGFIGSCLISRLNQENFNAIIAVDDFSREEKQANLEGKRILERVDREEFFSWLDDNYHEIEFLFHIGARTDTTEFDRSIFEHLNVEYSKKIWQKCIDYQIPLVYASSAATYGLGELGYDDNESLIPQLKPLNPYGDSKNDFDKWVLEQERHPFFWAGLKFFNVYGPNEYHKSRMASVIYHAYCQIKVKGTMKLFRSHNPNFADGEQMRDFIYVKDVVDVCLFLMHHRRNSGIYNLGSGKARTFLDLANNTFVAMGVTPQIEFVDTPEDIRDKYQYYTQASMSKLRSIGYTQSFQSLEEGITDYVKNYLVPGKYL
ncbi:ADP-L-glycero-D-manno-heptose 6-epimerase [Larkinella arboricola]|uniref:ADP-L-glycero-D-manno-heptose-6-epimerase n=1 Tax=Larkinella arboricola TaxID=643671 RepID=A0A327X0G1_LARAB|nr:ADP-glyceromanno-heptose 6-epimerase [Larkinella arboricola]RAJ99845.1 ADP-L-glycero-D-manno-heptose 6-epimerase [Larkinella arboricola]